MARKIGQNNSDENTNIEGEALDSKVVSSTIDAGLGVQDMLSIAKLVRDANTPQVVEEGGYYNQDGVIDIAKYQEYLNRVVATAPKYGNTTRIAGLINPLELNVNWLLLSGEEEKFIVINPTTIEAIKDGKHIAYTHGVYKLSQKDELVKATPSTVSAFNLGRLSWDMLSYNKNPMNDDDKEKNELIKTYRNAIQNVGRYV